MTDEVRNPPCAVFRRERSQNGHTLSVLKSGLQKYIRRGMTEKALYCAGELHSFRWAPEKRHVGRVGTNFRHRLMIVFLEDVAQVGLWRRLNALLDRVLSADDATSAVAVHEWVELLCAAPKSRVCSHARAVAQLLDPEDKEAAPALATARRLYPEIASLLEAFHGDPRRLSEGQWLPALAAALKQRSREACLWAYAIATNGSSQKTPHGSRPEWRILAVLERSCDPALRALIPAARRWFRELQNTREAFLCWMLPLLAHVNGHDPNAGTVVQKEAEKGAHAKFAAQEMSELDDFVFDIHVRANRGPAKGSGGLMRFVEEGCFVANESPAVDQVWKAFYNDRKRLAEHIAPVGPPRDGLEGEESEQGISGSLKDEEDIKEIEPEISKDMKASENAQDVEESGTAEGGEALRCESQFKFLVRAQLNTSASRTDVYFAQHPSSGRLVVVKGPFCSRNPVQRALEMSKWKSENGLPAARYQAQLLIPDRWPEGVALGLRNSVCRKQPAWFLIADSLLEEDHKTLPVRVHSSKVWPPTEVVDWTDAELVRRHVWDPARQWASYSAVEKKDYVLALLARFMWGIPDQADRNFLRCGGRVFVLDEDGRLSKDASVRLAAELRPKKAQLVREWTNRNWETLEPHLARWSVPAEIRGRWEEVKTRHKALALFSGHETKRSK